MSWADMERFGIENWGNLASVLGLMVSIWTLAVARKAREAAEAARTAARRQSLSEVLQDAVRKNEQVGIFLSQRQWNIVWLRAQETAGTAGLSLARWPQELAKESRSSLLLARQHSNSIADEAQGMVAEASSPGAIARMSAAQGRVAQLLNEVLGHALRQSEGGVQG